MISILSERYPQRFCSFVAVMPDIPENATWKQNGTTVAGGNGNGDATNQLSWPYGLFVDDDQTVFVADRWNHRIVRWKKGDTDGQIIASGWSEKKKLNKLKKPTDVLIDKGTDSLIICDWHNEKIVWWSRDHDPDQGKVLLDVKCWGLAMDDQIYLYVSDATNNVVKRYELANKNEELVASKNGESKYVNQLNKPGYLFVDQQQNVYVSDYENDRVVKWNKDATDGEVIVGCKDEKKNQMTDGQPDEEKRARKYNEKCENCKTEKEKCKAEKEKCKEKHETFKVQSEKCKDDRKRCNKDENECKKENEKCNVHVTKFKNESELCQEENKKCNEVSDRACKDECEKNDLTQLHGPKGIFVDELGTVYVADSGNNRVMRWLHGDKQGTVIVGGNGDGAEPNQLSYPTGLSFDRYGNLYVSDSENHRVQRFDINPT